MELESVSKFLQAVFYLTASILAILTYRSAKRGLLNTVNTEYHKKVIERLSALSNELYDEFDTSSPSYWAKEMPSKELISRMNEQARQSRHEILTSKDDRWRIGVPVTKSEVHLMNLSKKYKSDPFLPETVRSKLVTFLEGRLVAMQETHLEIADNI
jgi:hypothetical protein